MQLHSRQISESLYAHNLAITTNIQRQYLYNLAAGEDCVIPNAKRLNVGRLMLKAGLSCLAVSSNLYTIVVEIRDLSQ